MPPEAAFPQRLRTDPLGRALDTANDTGTVRSGITSLLNRARDVAEAAPADQQGESGRTASVELSRQKPGEQRERWAAGRPFLLSRKACKEDLSSREPRQTLSGLSRDTPERPGNGGQKLLHP